MKYIITAPQHIDADIVLPASKSISNRALVISALAGGNKLPQNLSDCDDTRVITRALANNPYEIDIMAAGTAMRFMTAYLCTQEGEHVITGTERMRHRPIGILVDALRYLGADIEYVGEEGYPPLKIKGKTLEGGRLEMPGNVSSQYISALLMIGPSLKNGIELHLKDEIVSRPYIDLTLWTMTEYGADVEWTDSEVKLEGLMDGSKQGDSVARYISSILGVKTAFATRKENTPTTVTLSRHMRTLPRLDYDFINSPDLAQTYVAACCAMNLPFHFTGLASLKIKETDRIEALKAELRKLGFVVKDQNNSELIWDGERCEPTGEAIDTYEDHRMAMAFAPLAIKLGKIEINNPQVVTKSYPAYWDDLKKAGFEICSI